MLPTHGLVSLESKLVELEFVVAGKTEKYFLDFRNTPFHVKTWAVSDTPDANSTWVTEFNETLSILSDQHYQPKMTLNNCHGHDFVIRDLCYWLFSNNPVAQSAGVVGMSNISNRVLGPIFLDLAPVAQTTTGSANQAECKQQ